MIIPNNALDSESNGGAGAPLSKFEVERIQLRNGHLERMAFRIVDELLNETPLFMDDKQQHIDFEDIKAATLSIARILDNLGVKTPVDE